MGRHIADRSADPTTREIDEMSSDFKSRFGYITKLQSRQLAWLKRWSRTERRERLRLYVIKCECCGSVDRGHVAAVVARILVQRHGGHETWLEMYPGSPVDERWTR
jgi:hypothetical protein